MNDHQVGDTVRHVHEDAKGWRSISVGKILQIVDEYVVVAVLKYRVEHKDYPEKGRDLVVQSGLVKAWTTGELQRVGA